MEVLLLETQIKFEELFNKNQTTKRIRQEFLDANIVEYLNEIKYTNPEFGIALLVQMVLHKRADISTMVGVLSKFTDSLQEASDLILEACEKDLVNYDTTIDKLIIKFNISDKVQKEIDLFQYPLPHVVEPEKVRTNKDTGYFTSSGSIILKKNHHEDDVVLDHINRMNNTALSINTDVVAFQKNKWRNLDKPKEGESRQEFKKRQDAFAYFDTNMREVITSILMITDTFWLTHKYDKRGRIYCCGHHVTYQGNDFQKAIVELADNEFIEL